MLRNENTSTWQPIFHRLSTVRIITKVQTYSTENAARIDLISQHSSFFVFHPSVPPPFLVLSCRPVHPTTFTDDHQCRVEGARRDHEEVMCMAFPVLPLL